ncbi:hypothetical protein [Serratia fonticola]
MNKCTFLCLGLCFLSPLSSASSPEAWGEFRRELLEACISKAVRIILPAQIISDSFGTEHYGVVLFKGKQVDENNFGYVVCIRDKKSNKTELTEFINEE